MIQFTDPRLFVQGICQAQLSDPVTGDIEYYNDVFPTGNISTSVTQNEIRGKLGNAIAAIIPSDSALTVEFTANSFSLYAKAAQLGAPLTYNAPHMVCETVTATDASLTAALTEGTPVAGPGYSDVFCYVQRVGAASPIATDGTAYAIDPATGDIAGFTATADETYKIWYFVQTASARMATIGTMFDYKVLHFTAQMPVYRNNGATTGANNGTRVGWLYLHVPYLKLGGNGGVTGDQSNNDTTMISGQAIAYDSAVVSATCNDCEQGTLAYYVYVPDNGAEDVAGVALVGGVVTAPVSSTVDLNGLFRLVMANGELVAPGASDLTYTLVGAISGTSITDHVLTTGATAGDAEITATYGATSYSTVANLSVVSA